MNCPVWDAKNCDMEIVGVEDGVVGLKWLCKV